MRAIAWMGMSLAIVSGCASTSSQAGGEHAHGAQAVASSMPSRPAAPLPDGALNPARGAEIGPEYEAWLSPHQEPDEEENTPSLTPAVFRSTAPSQSRVQREAAGHRAHGRVRFSRDLSRAYIDVRVEGVEARNVNMFHIHCGRPGILGPILVDFALATNVQENLADGTFTVELTNEHITRTVAAGHGLLGAFTAGCVIPLPSLGSLGPTRVSTIAGMAQLAAEGALYFNLHTTAQTFFGDMRGQILPVTPPR